MRKTLLFMLLLLSFPVVAVDDFETAGISEKLDALPGQFMASCKAETDAGLMYIEDKVDARIQTLPVMIGIASGFGVVAGYLTALVIQWLCLKGVYKRIYRANRALSKAVKDLESVYNG